MKVLTFYAGLPHAGRVKSVSDRVMDQEKFLLLFLCTDEYCSVQDNQERENEIVATGNDSERPLGKEEQPIDERELYFSGFEHFAELDRAFHGPVGRLGASDGEPHDEPVLANALVRAGTDVGNF